MAPVVVGTRPMIRAPNHVRKSLQHRVATDAQYCRHRKSARRLHIRSLVHDVREAAAGDEEMADALHEARERQRRDVARAAELVLGRPPRTAERDGIWAVTSPEVYDLLVEASGWSADQYEAWMAETLDRVVPRSPAKRRSHREHRA